MRRRLFIVIEKLGSRVKLYHILLILIILLGLILRINWLFIPFIGRHGWNEALYASIVEDYVINKLSYPYIVQYIRPDFNLGFLFYALGSLSIRYLGDHEWAYRLPIFFASLINIILFYFIGESMFNGRKRHALSLILALMYALVPLAVYYSARFQPEELMLLFYLASILVLIKYSKFKRRTYLLLSSFLLGVSNFLIKQVFMPFIITIIIVSSIIDLKYRYICHSKKMKLTIYNTLIVMTFFLIPLMIQLLLFYFLAPRNLYPIKFYLSRIIVGPLSRLLPRYSNTLSKIYVQGIDISKLFHGIELALGWPFGLPYLLMATFGLLILRKYDHLTSIDKINLLSNLLIGICILYVMRYHIVNHEYYLHVILFPSLTLLTIAIDYTSTKLAKCIKNKGHKYYVLLLVILIIFQEFSFTYSYIEYRNFKDGFANPSAIRAGIYIDKITSPNDVIIVQSPVMGFYAKRPNLHWGYLWILDENRLKHLGLIDMVLKGESLLEWDSIYTTKNASNIIRILEYWRPKVVVISPDVSYVFYRHRNILLPLLEYITMLYKKCNVIDFYTIKTRRYVDRYQIGSYIIYIIDKRQMLLIKKYMPLIEISIFLDDKCRIDLFKNVTLSETTNNSIVLKGKYGYINISFNSLNEALLINVKSSTNFVKIIIKDLSLYRKYTNVINTPTGVIMNLNLPHYKANLVIKTKDNKAITIVHGDDIIIKSKNNTTEIGIILYASILNSIKDHG